MAMPIAYRGMIFYFKNNAKLENLPTKKNEIDNDSKYVFLEDGVLIVADGIIQKSGDYRELRNELDHIDVIDYRNMLITPGFIDSHQHATQSSIVAAYGEKLLGWLETYVFPGEKVFECPDIARTELKFFLDEVLKNGITTAASYGPLFYEAMDIFFEELDNKNMRFIAGNVLMDLNAPHGLYLSTQENFDNCQKLITKWHNRNRLNYCITPRFALACSDQLLELCGSLKKEYKDCYIQTHLNENLSEIDEVCNRYPDKKNYLDVYDCYGLVTDQSIFGHCLHNSEAELELLQHSGAVVSWCPISNNFLGSGFFYFRKLLQYTSKITLGTDWGAGNSLSMFSVLDDAYKLGMLQNSQLSPMICWYLATLGAAKALQLDDKIGNFEIGKEADFIVIDVSSTPYLKYRREKIDNIFDLLFMLISLGSQLNIYATYVYGNLAYSYMNKGKEADLS